MESVQEIPKNKGGNPNWIKKAPVVAKDDIFNIDPKRRYHFLLTQTYEKIKPVDSKTGQISESPYPPLKMVSSEGIAFHDGEMRRWRYVYGYPTVWVDEQIKPVPTDQQINNKNNDLWFRDGNLFVNGSDKAKVIALMLQDEFEGQANPVQPSPKTFKLITEDDRILVSSEAADKAYEAEQAARNATTAEMLPLAMLFGINIDDPENREDLIRKQFILKARQLPDAFLKNYVSPKTNIKYLVTKALSQDIISGATGRIVITETGKVLFDVDKSKDIAEQVTTLIMENHDEATVLYAQLQKVLS